MKITRQKLLKRIAELDCTYEEGGGEYYEMEIGAPEHHKIANNGTHFVVCQQSPDVKRFEIYEALYNDLDGGVEKCELECDCYIE